MIPADTIARIKERTDIVALIGETVKLVRRGRSFLGLCPFHKEKSPSFNVHPERGFYHCFGCQESGSAIDFVMKTNGLEFLEAIQLLADRVGVVIEQSATPEASRAHKSERDELYAVNLLAATFFEGCLGLPNAPPGSKPHPLAHYAVRELETRGMPSPGTESEAAARWSHAVGAFKIGYAPPGWDGLTNFLRKQGVALNVGERAGLLVPGNRGHYDRFRHRLMFSVLDSLGRVIAFSGRALPAPAKEELAKHEPSAPSYDAEPPAKYINSPESPVYKKGEQLFGLFQAKQALRQRQEALLVEGNFDVVSLHANGLENTVAPLGTAFTSEQAKLLKRFTPAVVVLFDGDAAGKKATRAARIPCREGGLDAKVTTLPEGRDPDDVVRTDGPAALLDRIKNARGMLEHLVQEALDGDRFEGASLTERVARVRAVTKLLADEPDANIRLMGKRFADQLSTKLIVNNTAATDVSQLERLVATALRSNDDDGPRDRRGDDGGRPSAPAKLTADQRQALKVFGVLLDFPELLGDPDVAPTLDLLEGDVALAVASLRRALSAGNRAHDARDGSTSIQVPQAADGEEASARNSPMEARGRGGSERGLDVADFLATLPRPIQSFSAGRLASPTFDNASEAKTELLENTQKLRSLMFERQNSLARSALERSPSSLDDASTALLREVEQRARRKRGLQD